MWDDAGTFRIVNAARWADAVVVLHAFQKKTQKHLEAGHRHGEGAARATDGR